MPARSSTRSLAIGVADAGAGRRTIRDRADTPMIGDRTAPRTGSPFLRLCATSILLPLCALLVAGTASAQSDAIPAFKQLDSMEARAQGCVTCHGQSGQGTQSGYYPRIAGKPAGYIYNQLVAFRDGTRIYPPMNYLVASLPDAYLREMAEHFAKLRPSFEPNEATTASAPTLERGRSLATGGDSEHNIPACAACHGKGFTGMEPGIPGLVGLRQSYLVVQLTRWRAADRHARAPDCMERVASRLSDADITAVAAWLSQQSPPKDASPDSADRVRMPLACGSQG